MGGASSVLSNVTHTKPPRPGLFVCEGFAGSKPILPGGVAGAKPLEALVVTVGPEGVPILTSSEDLTLKNALPPSSYVAIILDPRSLRNELLTPFNTCGTNNLLKEARSQWNELLTFTTLAGKKVELFILLPSTTSCKR